jgi:hypothetical protein
LDGTQTNEETVRIIPLDFAINYIFGVVDTFRSPSRKKSGTSDTTFNHEAVGLWGPAGDRAADMHGKSLLLLTWG